MEESTGSTKSIEIVHHLSKVAKSWIDPDSDTRYLDVILPTCRSVDVRGYQTNTDDEPPLYRTKKFATNGDKRAADAVGQGRRVRGGQHSFWPN